MEMAIMLLSLVVFDDRAGGTTKVVVFRVGKVTV